MRNTGKRELLFWVRGGAIRITVFIVLVSSYSTLLNDYLGIEVVFLIMLWCNFEIEVIVFLKLLFRLVYTLLISGSCNRYLMRKLFMSFIFRDYAKIFLCLFKLIWLHCWYPKHIILLLRLPLFLRHLLLRNDMIVFLFVLSTVFC